MYFAIIVAVVVPSPAYYFVLFATYLINYAPKLCNLFDKFIYFATETPSFVIFGIPNYLLIMTFLPFGPKVAETAFAIVFHP